MAKQGKPTWPYRKETILTPAPNGQWCKKYHGKTFYFGPWHDPKNALERWRIEWPFILTGQPRPIPESTHIRCSLQNALQNFLTAKRAQLTQGDIVWSTFREYRDVCKRIIRVLGRLTDAAHIGKSHFEKLLADMEQLTPLTRRKLVVKIKHIFNWVADQYDLTIQFGPNFRGPANKAVRRQQNQREDKSLAADQIRTLLDSSNDQLHALILLGINGGFGNSDVANLPTAAVDLEKCVIDYYRHKTEAQRVVPLWPETITALKKVIVPDQELLFVDPWGKLLVRRGVDRICRMLLDLHKATNIKATYYQFRYTFSTIATELGDDHARELIMGHTIDGVSQRYIQRFPMDRLIRVTSHVRKWLFTTKPS